eukprot:gene5892-8130_t
MGNKISFSAHLDPTGPDDSVNFFKALEIRWINSVINRISSIEPIDLTNHSQILKWIDYNTIFSEIREEIRQEKRFISRKCWHIATLSYAMEKNNDEKNKDKECTDDDLDQADSANKIYNAESLKLPDDNYTDDDPSEYGDLIKDSDDELNKNAASDRKKSISFKENIIQKKAIDPNWDSSMISPIYFGYNTTLKKSEQDAKIKTQLDFVKMRENRAISKAKVSRGAVIDAFEKTAVSQQVIREKKLQLLQESYQKAKQDMTIEYDSNEKELDEASFLTFKSSWKVEMDSIEDSFKEEFDELKELHDEKCREDQEFLQKKREELESFKDAEKQEIPAAERLEEFARIEISRSIDELEKLSEELIKMRLEYKEMKDDFENQVLEANNSKNKAAMQRELNEMKSMVNVAETCMREAQTKAENALEDLLDSEALLERAVILKSQQDELLPLFRLFATNKNSNRLPGSCQLNLFIISLVLLMTGSFEQKYNYIFRLFDQNSFRKSSTNSSDSKSLQLNKFGVGESVYHLPFISNILSIVQESMYQLQMLSFTVNEDDLKNALFREFFSLNLDPFKDFITEYEMKQMILHLISHSYLINRMLGTAEYDIIDSNDASYHENENDVIARVHNNSSTVSSSTSTLLVPTTYSITVDNTQIKSGLYMSTYQRSRMSAIGLITRGMINVSEFKNRVHYEMNRYRPQLASNQKQLIHEKAMQMGTNDNLRTDYTKFLSKPKDDKMHKIEPLYHGHLSNFMYLEECKRINAAIKIQSVFRSYQDKKIAALAAKHLAFSEAKVSALKEMKLRIIKEFKKRESNKGMGKMKWDATVRMRQAKLRTMGSSVSRSDTVMILMEEAISNATVEIEKKFIELEKQEKLYGVSFDSVYVPPLELSDANTLLDISELFDILIHHEVYQEEDEPKPGPNDGGVMDGDTFDDQSSLADSSVVKDDESSLVSLAFDGLIAKADSSYNNSQGPIRASITHGNNISLFLKGNHNHHMAHVKGENQIEFVLRMYMSLPENIKQIHLFNRLRVLSKSLTSFKSQQLLYELPTKRLLLKYISYQSIPNLTKDLQHYFKFISLKNSQSSVTAHQVAIALKKMISTDIEYGVLPSHLSYIQQLTESGVNAYYFSYLDALLANFSKMMEMKLQTNASLKEEILIKDELVRAESLVSKHKSICMELVESIESTQGRFKKALLSFNEVSKKYKSIQYYSYVKHSQQINEQKMKKKKKKNDHNNNDGNLLLNDSKLEIPVEFRQNWMQRLNKAMLLIESNAQDKEAKHVEIRNICKEFIDIATSDAMIIVNEIHQPRYLKTIPVSQRFVCNNNGNNSGNERPNGRDIEDGAWYEYEAHNIIYSVCLDYDGIYNGSDEYAMKAGGKHRLSALEYNKLHIPRLNIPLIATIDYHGFRVIAQSKLPIQQISYNDEGEIRKITEEMVYGVMKAGDNFINRGKIAQTLLKTAANKLNLCEHYIQGFKDIAPTLTYGSSSLKIYKSLPNVDNNNEEQYYVTDFWRCFPPEIESQTSHLHPSIRNQSIMWRFLRPELVKNYSLCPLSPDAASTLSYNTENYQKYYHDVENATFYLINEVIPHFVENQLLSGREYDLMALSEGFSIDWSNELHSHGINIRHLGLIRSMLWHALPGKISLYHHENSIKTAYDMREEVRMGYFIKVINHRNDKNDVLLYDKMKEHTHGKRKSHRYLTHNQIPVANRYKGESMNNLRASVGNVKNDKYNTELRQIILCEMLARTIKSLLRHQLRLYNKKNLTSSSSISKTMIIEYLNICTGASENSDNMFQQIFYESLRERYGPYALTPSERFIYQGEIQSSTVLIYLINRIIVLTGLRLSIACLQEFDVRASNFVFHMSDVVELRPIVKHNLSILPYAEGIITSTKASQLEQSVDYIDAIVQDKPVLVLTCSERKGSRNVFNKHGSLGHDYDGALTTGCELEHMGPIEANKFIRSISFRPLAISYIDVKHHPHIVPSSVTNHYTIELYFNCQGGKDMAKIVFMSGRNSLSITRDNSLIYSFYEGTHEVLMNVTTIQYNEWYHFVVSYDGTTARCYVNGQLTCSLEIDPVIQNKIKVQQQLFAEQFEVLNEQEKTEKSAALASTQQAAAAYFSSKDGVNYLKKTCVAIMESDEFQNLNIGHDAKDSATAIKMKRTEGLRQAKQRYIDELYTNNILEIAQRYVGLRQELADSHEKIISDGELKVYEPLRFGCSNPTANNRIGQHFFYGLLSCISVYYHKLDSDRIRTHYITSKVDKRRDIQRLYSNAAAKYLYSLLENHEGEKSLQGYSTSICKYLLANNDNNSVTLDKYHDMVLKSSFFTSNAMAVEYCGNYGKSYGKIIISNIFDRFYGLNLSEGIADIIKRIPHDGEFAELIVKGILLLKKIGSGQAMDSKSIMKTIQKQHEKIMKEEEKSLLEEEQAAHNNSKEINPKNKLEKNKNLRKLNEEKSNKKEELQKNDSFIELKPIYDQIKDNNNNNNNKKESFFSRSIISLTRKDLVYLPFIFGLTEANSPVSYWEAAAYMFQEVMKDMDLIYVYGELDLRWLPELNNPLLVISLVKHAEEDRHLKVMKIPDMFKSAGFDMDEDYDNNNDNNNNNNESQSRNSVISVTDDDVLVLSRNAHTGNTEGIDLSDCRFITDTSINHIIRIKNLKILNLSRCVSLTDEGLKILATSSIPSTSLEILILEGCVQLTDVGIEYINKQCKKLLIFNINECVHVSYEPLQSLLKANRRLTTLQISRIGMLNDYGLSTLTSILATHNNHNNNGQQNPSNLTSLDVSYNIALSDFSLINLSQVCSKLKVFNLSGCRKVTDEGISAICSNCWYLQSLNLEDCYLLRDDAFFFNPSKDGRSLTNQHMCTSLVSLNLTDCIFLTDQGLKGISERCRQVDTLILTGCDAVTDRGLQHLMNDKLCSSSNLPCCDSIKRLSLQNCGKVTSSGVINLLSFCGILEDLNLSGLSHIIDDSFIHQLCTLCPSINKLNLTKCYQISNLALCHIADFLWCEELNLSGCSKVTDSGIEVLTEANNGIFNLLLNNNEHITDQSLLAIKRNCKSIKRVEIKECQNVNQSVIQELKLTFRTLKLIH